MPVKKLIINSVELDLDKLISNNKNRDMDREGYIPLIEDGTCIFMPLKLLDSLLGFKAAWKDDGDVLILQRAGATITMKISSNEYFVNNSKLAISGQLKIHGINAAIPVQVLTEGLGLKIELSKDKILEITDPVTLPLYSEFSKIYPISSLHKVFISDLDNDGINEYCTAYINHKKELCLAVLTADGRWLLDYPTKSLMVNEFRIIHPGSQNIIAINCYDGGHQSSLYTGVVIGEQLYITNEFSVTGYINIVSDKIHMKERLYDAAEHGINRTYSWNSSLSCFEEESCNVFYWNEENCVDRRDAEQVAQGFYEAVLLGMREEAAGYCTDAISADEIEGLCNYHIYSYRAGQAEDVHVKTLCVEDNRAIVFVYFAEYDVNMYREPNRIFRVVMELAGEEWKIMQVVNLRNRLPVELITGNDITLVPAGKTVFTDSPAYHLWLGKQERVRISWIDNEIYFGSVEVYCSCIKFIDLLPGIRMEFPRSDNSESEIISIEAFEADSLRIYKEGEDSLIIEINVRKHD